MVQIISIISIISSECFFACHSGRDPELVSLWLIQGLHFCFCLCFLQLLSALFSFFSVSNSRTIICEIRFSSAFICGSKSVQIRRVCHSRELLWPLSAEIRVICVIRGLLFLLSALYFILYTLNLLIIFPENPPQCIRHFTKRR